MPPGWSSRFLSSKDSNPSSTNGTPTRNPPLPRLSSRDKPLPRPPSAAHEEPTLIGRDGERSHAPLPQTQQASPSRPRTTDGRHTHGRSVSHPLPKIFGRKKSAGQLGTSYHDTDVPLDDELVPVLDDGPTATPTRVISGKKRGKAVDDGDKVNRKCMCCDAWVKVPRELDKFRCMSCYTINDLKPVEEQRSDRDEKEKRGGSKGTESGASGVPQALKTLPVSLERTRAIIDRCIMTYLEVRCRREEHAGGKKPESPLQTPEEKENPMNSLPIRNGRQISQGTKQLTDAPMSSSPPGTPEAEPATVSASANITDLTDIDLFAYYRTDTPPPATGQVKPHGPGPPAPISRKPVPIQPNRKPPPPPLNATNRAASQRYPSQNGELSPKPHISPKMPPHDIEQRRRYDRVKTIFRPLEDYVAASFGDFRCINASFSTLRPLHAGRARSESNIVTPPPEPVDGSNPSPADFSQLDAKTLLLGDIGENSTWWTGRLDRNQSDKATKRKKVGGDSQKRPVSSKSPNVNWAELDTWYSLVQTAGEDWQGKVPRLRSDAPGFAKEKLEGFANIEEIEDDLAEGREHAIRAVLKVTENLLKRPSRQIKDPDSMRFLLILLANPSLYPARRNSRRPLSRAASGPQRSFSGKQSMPVPPNLSPRKSPGGRESSQHTGILKRIFGLMANSPDVCHRYLIGWFARFDEEHLVRIIDLVSSFVTYRITRQQGRPHTKSMIADGGLIPDLSGSAMNTSQQLHAAMGLSGSVKKRADDPDQEPEYAQDWQVKAAAKLMSLLFAANNVWQGKRRSTGSDRGLLSDATNPAARARRSGQLLHTSSFYNTLLDYLDVIADFKVWESKRDKFAFCQFPLFLSMGNKIKVLEYDARRQMEIRAREAYFDSVIRQRAQDGYFHLRVRRDCMVDDSLRQISEAVGAGQEELKKGLRVHFTGEEGVDAGGPRKEWFLMIVRDIFDPNHGMFVYDDESQTCYFNPNSFETSDQYHLVGALLGLAIYNSTILDIALPPFAFRKLLAAAPAAGAGGNANISSLTGTKGQMTYTLSDLAEFRPSLASGLQQLLDYDGDVEETYAWDFVAPIDRYGIVTNVPLISNGEATPVTNANRHEFVDAYVRYLLDTAVARQFEPFKRGFFHVCAGNALSLFRAEEIELLIRGSDEALAVDQLKAVAVYENWKYATPLHQAVKNPIEEVPVIQWFWEVFGKATPVMQRKLLSFITGTDRIPAVGATSLILRIVAGGDGWGGGAKEERERFPIARTCFNMLVLWRYETREELEGKLWRAVEESEGFGLK